MGDRVLAGYLGKANGGIISLSTYSYSDLNGKGEANVH